MFEFLLVIASTLIYFQVFSYKPSVKSQGTQTDPWEPTQILDLMDVSMSSELCTASIQFVDWFETDSSLSSEIELPLERQHKV